MVRKIINAFTWLIFIGGFLLTSVVAIAQTSVPGDSTYGVKTGFEKIVLSGYRLVHKDTDYQIDLTKLRFKESQKVLKSAQGGVSLENLNLQILSTQENITNIQDATKKSSYAKKYVSTLKEIKTQLDYEKLSIVSSSSTGFSASSTNTTSRPPITDQIDDTRNQIDETIGDLEEEIPDDQEETTASNPTTAPTPTLIPTINPTTAAAMVITLPTLGLTPKPTVPTVVPTDIIPTRSLPLEPTRTPT